MDELANLLIKKEQLQNKIMEIEQKIGFLLEEKESYDQILSQIEFYFKKLKRYDSFLEDSKNVFNIFLAISAIEIMLLNKEASRELVDGIEKIGLFLLSSIGIVTLNIAAIKQYFIKLFNKMGSLDELEIQYYDIMEKIKGLNNASINLSTEFLEFQQQLNEVYEEINKYKNKNKNKVFTKNIST